MVQPLVIVKSVAKSSSSLAGNEVTKIKRYFFELEKNGKELEKMMMKENIQVRMVRKMAATSQCT